MKFKEPSFSLYDFRNWLGANSKSRIIMTNNNGLKPGDQVLVRLSEKNMINKLSSLNEDKKNISEICQNLKYNGGTLKRIKGSNAEIKVLGLNETIIVPRLFLRRHRS